MKQTAYAALSCAAFFSLAGCGGSGSGNFSSCIVYKGLTYCTATSPYTGRTWLDRNLGATEACTALDDANCFGDYYQWGRLADGHEKADSNVSTALATDIANAGSDFIKNASAPYDWVQSGVDDDGSLRSAQWSETDGTSVCPAGYRVPTKAELNAELFSADHNITDKEDAFGTFLKLPSAGYRDNGNGTMSDVNTSGYLWSTTVHNGIDGNYSYFAQYAEDANISTGPRARGQAVRCILE